MDPATTWILVALAVLAVVALVWFALPRLRARELAKSSAPDHERRVIADAPAGRLEPVATGVVEPRAPEPVKRITIKPLSSDDAIRFGAAWRQLQSQFVDDPETALSEADRLVGDVMSMRGYPVGDFEQRVADISADHPDVIINYRAAREIAVQHARGDATTEDLRQAMVHYRALFRHLLETSDTRSHDRPPAREVTSRL